MPRIPVEAAADIRDRFTSVSVETYPFPHFVLPSVLPEQIYKEMEGSLPPPWRWKAAVIGEALKRYGPIGLAKAIIRTRYASVQPHFSVRNPDTAYDFGLRLYRDEWIERFGPVIELIDRLTVETFRPHIASYRDRLARAGVAMANAIDFGQALFCQRTEHWTISRHTHSLSQIIRSMIYFPLPESSIDQGTVLYRLRRPLKIPLRNL
jgi:hypothetical protein